MIAGCNVHFNINLSYNEMDKPTAMTNMTMNELQLSDLFEGNFYHVCTNGLEDLVLLRNKDDYKVAWNYLALSAWKTDMQVITFTLMSNHIHALVACQKTEEVDLFIKTFKHLLSKYLNKRHGLKQSLHNTKDCISFIHSVQYLKNCIAYILRNPVCAKLCAKPEDYPWSSYRCLFSEKTNSSSKRISSLSYRSKRSLLRSNMDLSRCPLTINEDGMIDLHSLVRTDIAEKAYRNSGKSFLYFLGCCDDVKMEYELAYQPLMNISDNEMYDKISRYASNRFHGRNISELKTAEKCSMVKFLYFNNKTSIPQLSRILGLPRKLIHQIMSS